MKPRPTDDVDPGATAGPLIELSPAVRYANGSDHRRATLRGRQDREDNRADVSSRLFRTEER